MEAKHATRWLSLGGFRFQPSEMIKPWFILFTAGYIERMGPKIQSFKQGLLPLLCMQGFVLLLILKQPDFGTTVTIGSVLILMVFVAGAKLEHLLALVGSGLITMAYLIFSTEYRRKRFFSFLNPWADPQGDGFQMIQSLIAFERGGLAGQGLGDGTQKLLYLPEAHTDFIFSVIGEELGFIGCAAVVILFFIIMVQGIRLSIRIQDQYASILAMGITVLISLQGLFNMGVVMGLLPTKGLTLPLVSYGGSSLISTMFSLGLLLSLSSSISHQKAKISRVL
ncbi:MAG: putative peptidoglycan glycosyltransferase FtsW [Bdellovibrionota bacterium]